jgi:shikimate kinase/3-dehydroquinate synthase
MRRPLLISGFMGSGKTTIGRRVAELAKTPFEDLDARIELRAGRAIAEIFRTDGEGHFRELERRELEALLADPRPRVVALGGGSLLRRDSRLDALERAVVVTLWAAPETIAARTRGEATRPLLASAEPAARIAELYEQRAIGYSECHARIDTDKGDVDQHAQAVLAVWRRDPIAVAIGRDSYAVDVGHAIASERIGQLARGTTAALLISDENVAPLHKAALDTGLAAAGLTASLVVLEPGEQHKQLESIERLWQACAAARLDRKSLVIALGGGVVSDLAGFCAATWMRGLRWLALPTTLLAMVDASVGGKTGFDWAQAKNAVGAFWQPLGVACDVAFLATEPARGYVSALAEVVKTALIGDAELLALVEQQSDALLERDSQLLIEVVRRCIAVKARIVSRDERESGLRAVLNLGHSVGHALEAQGDYTVLSHGEAVSLGLCAALRIGGRLGHTPSALAARIEALLDKLGLPIELETQPLAEAATRLELDKKRSGRTLRFVVARDVADVTYIDLPIDVLAEHVRRLKN